MCFGWPSLQGCLLVHLTIASSVDSIFRLFCKSCCYYSQLCVCGFITDIQPLCQIDPTFKSSLKELHQIKISFNRNRVVCECEHEHTVLCWAVMTWNVVHAIIFTITEVFWQRHTPPPLTTCPALQICLPAVSPFSTKGSWRIAILTDWRRSCFTEAHEQVVAN